MCEIHFIKTLNRKIEKKDIENMLELLKLGKIRNKDGWGITNTKIIYKRNGIYKSKLDSSIIETFNNSNFLLSHNRLSTIGKDKKLNSHPFSNKRFIWLHNGHISNYEILSKVYKIKNINVDSQIIGELLLKECELEKNIVIALKNTIEKLNGSFSVFVYDKITKRLFYFLHSAYFQFRLLNYKNDFIIIGDTSESNLDNIYLDSLNKNHGFKELKYKIVGYLNPIENRIYEISNTIKALKKFEVDYTYVNYVDSYENDDSEFYNYGYTIFDLENILSNAYDSNISIKKNKKKKGKKRTYRIICDDNITELLKIEYFYNDDLNHLTFDDLINLIEYIQYQDSRYNNANNEIEYNNF
jgi:predicted glutamine amidotransferase